LFGGGHAGTQWKRGCYNQQKPRKMHFHCSLPPKRNQEQTQGYGRQPCMCRCHGTCRRFAEGVTQILPVPARVFRLMVII
jgi:hypothetical protein